MCITNLSKQCYNRSFQTTSLFQIQNKPSVILRFYNQVNIYYLSTKKLGKVKHPLRTDNNLTLEQFLGEKYYQNSLPHFI